MVYRLAGSIVAFALCCSIGGGAMAQSPDVTRTITVKDGLPQSYVSGIYQDRDGYLWIATLNGFCRYDGRKFTHYRHTYADTAGLSNNIILHLFDQGDGHLLLCYMDGRIDAFNTVTKMVDPLWRAAGFGSFRSESVFFKTLVQDSKGICRMLGEDGIYRIDPAKKTVTHRTLSQLQLTAPVIGLAILHDSLCLFTDTMLIICDKDDHPVKKIRYPFGSIKRFANTYHNFYSPGQRDNGDLLFCDATGIKIWNPATQFYQQSPLDSTHSPGKLIATFDHAGNYFFKYNDGSIFILRPDNTIEKWAPESPESKGILTSMYVDRSGVLWVGTNGYGLRQYDLQTSSLHGYRNQHSFVTDVLEHYGVPGEKLAASFLGKSVPFANRSTTWKDSLWVTDAYRHSADLSLALFAGHAFQTIRFRPDAAASETESPHVLFLCFTEKGKLWGIDHLFHLLQFNIGQASFHLYPAIDLDQDEEVNGMTSDGDAAFFISTNKNLVRFDASTGQTEKLTTLIPSKDLLTVTKDPNDQNILWIGTLSEGLIRYNKQTRKNQVFSIATGLPNNTIYSIIQGSDSLLWCSSNKGIFAFNQQNQTVRSFTSRDGLIDDEFNRWYYLSMPNGDLAFGGPLGYTIFNPSRLEPDVFDPEIALTDLNIINWSLAGGLLDTISSLHLGYDQNFITAEFAGMQFDFPEKLQYRYMLQGFDKSWIMMGNDNHVSYTNLPAGKYTLLLDVTNTNGKWSSHTKRISINIDPPFWRTWWFYAAVAVLIILIAYLIQTARIRRVKRAHTQQLAFERKAMELHAMALRARMNPHFIFNCLNSIKALIQEKEDKKAIAYLTTFVTLIRKQLNNTSDLITLREELETCKLYLELEMMRFDDRIAYRMDLADRSMTDKIMVPPLLLQPLIENAIVHGLLPSGEGGLVQIRLYRENGSVICAIEDNGIGRAAAEANKQKSSRLHESRGVRLLEERISIHHRLNEWSGSMKTIDLYHPDGRPSGTLVILQFNADI